MRVAIAGAGAVGRSVAAELLENGHEVLLIDKDPRAIKADSVPEGRVAARRRLRAVVPRRGRSATLRRRHRRRPATTRPTWSSRCWPRPSSPSRARSPGSTTPSNEWLFNESWGVDVSVSTPRIMSALVEEAVTSATSSGCSRSGRATPTWSSSPCPTTRRTSARRSGTCPWPVDTSLVAVLRDGHVHQLDPDATLEAHDELLFVANDRGRGRARACSWPRTSTSPRAG